MTFPDSSGLSLDTLSILNPSVQVYTSLGIPVKTWAFDAIQKKLFLKDSTLRNQDLKVCYRVLSTKLDQTLFLRDSKLIDSSGYYSDAFALKQKQAKVLDIREELFSSTGLNKTGNISRGISFGNSQDVVVNSSLNLQLEGKLSPELRLKAAISDQNIPIQPDGNTAQLQDFDRVYIELEHEKGKLSAGDLQFKNKADPYFLKYFKNVQGGAVDATYKAIKDQESNTYAGIGVSKGKFASINIQVQEGILGPYRITGPNGERFLVLLANTEKIYLDGRLLKRGFNLDYTIDYNQAIVTLTSNVLVTRYSRLRVDFEYSDRNFNRSTIMAGHTQKLGKAQMGFHYYSEKDDPNSVNSTVSTLTDQDKTYLSGIGDTLDKAFISSAVQTAFNSSQVLYKKLDTTIASVLYPGVYVYSIDQSKTLYQLSFSDLGEGNGDYVFVPSTANGRLYEWIAPVNGMKQGRYEPVKLIITPKQKDMVVLNGKLGLRGKENLYAEAALSKNDVNLFSSKDKFNDQGYAIKAGYQNPGLLLSKTSNWQWLGSLDYEYTNPNFNPIDRFRYVEYDRDWSNPTNYQITNNLRPNFTPPSDHIIQASVGLKNKEDKYLQYQINRRLRSGEVNGWQQKWDASYRLGNLVASTQYFNLQNTLPSTRSDWQRWTVNVLSKNKFLQPGYQYQVDQNTIKSLAKDSIIGSAMYYQEHKVYVKTADTLKTQFTADYAWRRDQSPIRGDLPLSTDARTANATISTQIFKVHNIKLNGTYRELTNALDTTSGKKEQTLMGRLDHSADLFKNHIRTELTYTTSTGRELRKQYIFIQVPSGQGDYIWQDGNADGVQQLDEFYPKVLSGNNVEYIKTFIPTDQFIKAYTSTLSYRLNAQAPRNWRESTGMKKWIGKWSNTSSLSTERKTTSDALGDRFVPIAFNDKDSLSSNANVRSNFFFNRTNPQYGWDVLIVRTFQRQFLTNGFERRNTGEWTLNGRVAIKSLFNARLSLSTIQRGSNSDYLLNRNYLIESYVVKPELSYQPSTKLRFTTSYTLSQKTNILPSDVSIREKSQNQEWSLDTRLTQLSNRSITANVKYIEIKTQNLTSTNNAVSYELLDALRPGSNFTWSLIWQQKLSSGLQLSINYEGRKSQENNAVHVGRMQISALF